MSDLPVRPDPAASDADLARALVDLGRHLEYPPTPDVSGAVRTRLLAEPARRRGSAIFPAPRWSVWRSLAWVALVLALLAGSVLLLSPDARRAVAERLGLPGVTIEYLQPPSSVITPATATPVSGSQPAQPNPAPPPTALPSAPNADRLDLGERLPGLADARTRVAYSVLAPTLSDLSAPDEVYLSIPPVGGQVALVYRSRPGLPAAAETGVALLFTQFRGTLQPEFFGKGLPRGTRLEQVTLSGRPAYWIDGGPHFFFYRDQSGRQTDERFRLAANVLLWEQGGLTLRIEGMLLKEQALRIAASVR